MLSACKIIRCVDNQVWNIVEVYDFVGLNWKSVNVAKSFRYPKNMENSI